MATLSKSEHKACLSMLPLVQLPRQIIRRHLYPLGRSRVSVASFSEAVKSFV